jgi:hypothetical protein
MSRDNTIADRLRNAGLSVVEVDGWRDRGSSDFNPRGSVNHHTAGPKDGNIPSLNTLIYGRSDLPGPLCNVAQARNNDIYVIASGRANHAGSGDWRGLSGNSSVWGLEIEHTGTSSESWTEDRVDTAARVHAALIRGTTDASMVCQHKEWAPDRKIDAYQSHGDTFRNRINQHLSGSGGGTPPPPSSVIEEMRMFALVQPDDGRGVYRFSGQGMIGVPDPNALAGDQIMLAVLGLDATVWQVDNVWFNSWPVIRG